MSRPLLTAALALAVVCPVDSWAADPPAPSLTLIPGRSAAFLHFRAGDWWQSPAGRAYRDGLAKVEPRFAALVEEHTGLPPDDIDTVTLLVPDLELFQGPVALVTTRRPLDRAKVAAALGRTTERVHPSGVRLYGSGEEFAVFLDARRFVATNRGSAEQVATLVGRMFDAENKEPDSVGLKATLAYATNSKAPLTFGLNLRALPPPGRGRAAPPLDKLVPLPKAEEVFVAAEVGGTSNLFVRVTYPNAADAAAGLPSVRTDVAAAAEILGMLADVELPTAAGDVVRRVARAAADGLKGAPVRVEGRSVDARTAVATPDLGDGAQLAAATVEFVRHGRTAVVRARVANNLKHLALAAHDYAGANFGEMPAHAVYSKDGKTPLLSWRVALLPYVEEGNLWRQFRLDEPWDSDHNKALIEKMPSVFESPNAPPLKEKGRTRYQVFVGPKAAWQRGPRGPRMPQTFFDGTSNTILIAEAAEPVIWTKPDDIAFDPDKPMMPRLGADPKTGVPVALADGSVRWLKRTLSEKTLKAAITASGNDELGPDW